MTETVLVDRRSPTSDQLGLRRGSPSELRRQQKILAAWWLAAVCWLVVACTGCMHRRMTITSNPPGAQVLVDGEPIGYTPTSIDFTYYGTREVTLVKDGYKTVTSLEKLSTPWYQLPPLEFVTDNFWPTKIRDNRLFHYELEPQTIEPTDTLLERADSLRNRAKLP